MCLASSQLLMIMFLSHAGLPLSPRSQAKHRIESPRAERPSGYKLLDADWAFATEVELAELAELEAEGRRLQQALQREEMEQEERELRQLEQHLESKRRLTSRRPRG